MSEQTPNADSALEHLTGDFWHDPATGQPVHRPDLRHLIPASANAQPIPVPSASSANSGLEHLTGDIWYDPATDMPVHRPDLRDSIPKTSNTPPNTPAPTPVPPTPSADSELKHLTGDFWHDPATGQTVHRPDLRDSIPKPQTRASASGGNAASKLSKWEKAKTLGKYFGVAATAADLAFNNPYLKKGRSDEMFKAQGHEAGIDDATLEELINAHSYDRNHQGLMWATKAAELGSSFVPWAGLPLSFAIGYAGEHFRDKGNEELSDYLDFVRMRKGLSESVKSKSKK